MNFARNLSICVLLMSLLGSRAVAADASCEGLFKAQDTIDMSVLDGLFPNLEQIHNELATNPQESTWRHLNRRLDRLYLSIEKSDFLKTASEDLLFSMALRLLEIQKELEIGSDPKQLRVVFAESQRDTIQDVKSRIYMELRSRGTLFDRLTKPVGPLAPYLRRDLLLQFGLSRPN